MALLQYVLCDAQTLEGPPPPIPNASRTSHRGAACQDTLGPLHSLLLTVKVMWLNKAA